ncbi:hypothetical protein M5K25_010717 [Dendrobium thyrsiflorum]|uniref:4-coumarate--CoA ligase n=2 Tax=Magnoliopsida TaxID=3398 RepID=A0ABD0V0C4_DENTH
MPHLAYICRRLCSHPPVPWLVSSPTCPVAVSMAFAVRRPTPSSKHKISDKWLNKLSLTKFSPEPRFNNRQTMPGALCPSEHSRIRSLAVAPHLFPYHPPTRSYFLLGFWGHSTCQSASILRRPFPSSVKRVFPCSSLLEFSSGSHAWLLIIAGFGDPELSLPWRKCSPLLDAELLSNASALSSNEWRAVPDIWKSATEKYGHRTALVDLYHDPPTELTYRQLEEHILDFSEGLRVVGLLPEEKIALFAENSCRWLVADQGTMATGAINVVRGTRASNDELVKIYNHSDSIALVVDNPEFFNRLAESLIARANIRFLVLLWGDKLFLNSEYTKDILLYDFKEIIELGRESRLSLLSSSQKGEFHAIETIEPDDIATLMYTSGTSGMPKGVMLSHRNLLHQIKNLLEIVPMVAGDRFLSILPSWHAYERAAEYFTFTHGVEQVYTNVAKLKDDLKRFQPQYIVLVPLVYETLYSSIHKQISSSSAARKFVALSLIRISLLYMEAKRIYEGKVLTKKKNQDPPIVALLCNLWGRVVAAILWPFHILGMKLVYCKMRSAIGISKAGISGGGSLPLHIDKFFEAIGLKLQNGYGLTETSPVVACRRPDNIVLGTVGHPLNFTEIMIVDLETGRPLPDGSKGIVKVRGPQVMNGYYKNESSTGEAIDEDGWFNSGDIGWIVPKHSTGMSRRCGGMLVLEGRAKDTIVLSTGENVEPSELEEAVMRSNLIQHIVVVGQDQRRLGALIVPNRDELLLAAKNRLLINDENSELSKDKMVNLLHDEVRNWTKDCSFHIGPIMIVDEPFTVKNGLMTPTMKVRRDKVIDLYKIIALDMRKVASVNYFRTGHGMVDGVSKMVVACFIYVPVIIWLSSNFENLDSYFI